MQTIKAKIKITGRRVHDVGYRVLLVNKALSLGVDNFNAFNTYLDDVQTVIVVIETDAEAMEEFKGFVISSIPEKSIVDDVSFDEHRNSVPPIERVLQSFQVEQWGKGIPILLQMLDKQDQMLGIQDQMLDKQDTNTSILREFKEESSDNFNDLKSIMAKHDADAGDRFSSILVEISDIKKRLSNVESVVSVA